MQLRPNTFHPLKTTEIKPLGWLKRQLETQKEGLTGNLHRFWPDIKDSGWTGGLSEGWERLPYWLDGYIPLAYQCQDKEMIQNAAYYINEILARQKENGWFGPEGDLNYGYLFDPWPNFVICKALIQYYEAENDPRVPAALEKFFRFLQKDMPERILRSWGRYRWMDLNYSIYWLYDLKPQPWLLELAALAQSQGFDWHKHFLYMPYRERIVRPEMCLDNHVVNCAMGLKTSAIRYRLGGEAKDESGTMDMITQLDKYHGQATGAFSGGEHLGGKSPVQGTELCAIVEYMFSLEVAGAVFGDPALFDRLEMLTYNALPATISPDMWAHQYDQQVNQMQCIISKEVPWTTNGPDANTFGLEPNFGCCTANMHQGWPKFTASLWMKTSDGIAATAYAPCSAETDINGKKITLTTETDYPFKDHIRINIESPEENHFALHLRVPSWAQSPLITLDGAPIKAKAGGYCVIERTWSGVHTVELRLNYVLRSAVRYNEAVSFYYGPLLLALNVRDQAEIIRTFYKNHSDVQLFPKTAWNYAVELAADGLPKKRELSFGSIPPLVFSPEAPPLSLTVTGRKVLNWVHKPNSAVPPLPSDCTLAPESETIILQPYGCTNLRMGELPAAQ